MSPEARTPAALTMRRYEEYVGTIRELWDAFNRADWETSRALAHPEIELQDYPGLPDAEWHHGPGASTAWTLKLFETFGQLHVEPREFIPTTDDTLIVVVRVNLKGKRGGVPGQFDAAALVTMRDGLPARMALYTSKAEALRGAAEALEAVGLSE